MQDVPPYILAAGTPLKFGGINNIGLKRRGFSVEGRKIIKDIYKLYFRSDVNRIDTIVKIYNKFPDSEYKTRILDFIQSSDRGIIYQTYAYQNMVKLHYNTIQPYIYIYIYINRFQEYFH